MFFHKKKLCSIAAQPQEKGSVLQEGRPNFILTDKSVILCRFNW